MAGGKKPVVLVVGMAGSGKTTFMQRLQADLTVSGERVPYLVNLDPAVLDTPYESNLDIRDTVDYKQVMAQYGLGPNGAILTALNLFTTKWDQVLDLIDTRQEEMDICLVDTPGQIEIFTWSASGTIIAETCASMFPTCIAYILDLERCAQSPIAFMSNMLYACSIMYKMRLPFILVMNKSDIADAGPVTEWLGDYFAFQTALTDMQSESYLSSMMQSMGLVLEEFYQNIRHVVVSSYTGDGMDDFLTKVDEAVEEYEKEFLPDLERRIQLKSNAAATPVEDQLSNLSIDKSD